MLMIRGPMMLCGLIGACVAVCGCMRCLTACRLRNCALVKHFLLCTGQDPFDDFELMVLVHEAMFESVKKDKLNTIVQVTAGDQHVQTNAANNSIFQQPLHITVEQGTEEIVVDLLNTSGVLLATVRLNTVEIYEETNCQPEVVYTMAQKGKGIHNPKIKLTMVVSAEEDEEKGLVQDGMGQDVAVLVRQQLKKAKQQQKHGGDIGGASELEILRQACAGPLEVAVGMGHWQKVYVAVVGPPLNRRWVMGMWTDQRDYQHKGQPMREISLTKIQSIQGDPSRNHVFVVNCYDEQRVRHSLTFRRIDRARDVWVEILHLLVSKARDAQKQEKDLRQTRRREDSHDFDAGWDSRGMDGHHGMSKSSASSMSHGSTVGQRARSGRW